VPTPSGTIGTELATSERAGAQALCFEVPQEPSIALSIPSGVAQRYPSATSNAHPSQPQSA